MFDRNNDGVITADELASVMQSLGEDPPEGEVQEMIYQVDQEGKGAINFEEFVVMMERKSSMAPNDDEEIKEAFAVFDKDLDGFITAEEMREVLANFESSITIEEIEEMIKEFDMDGDAMLSFEEFTNLMRTTNGMGLTSDAVKAASAEKIAIASSAHGSTVKNLEENK